MGAAIHHNHGEARLYVCARCVTRWPCATAQAVVSPDARVADSPTTDRDPYVGSGADGARRSAQIDREEADCLPIGEARDRCLVSAERWDRQAEHLELGVGEVP